MQGLLFLIGLSVTIISLLGVLVSGVWLGFLGEWRSIWIGSGMMLLAWFSLSLLTIPGALMTVPGLKALQAGRIGRAILFAAPGHFYTNALVLGWGYGVLSFFSALSSGSSETPLLLWSYGAAVVPWAILTQREPADERPIHILFLTPGYISCIMAIKFAGASLDVCFWILCGFMACALVLDVVLLYTRVEDRARVQETVRIMQDKHR